ncbi:SWIM zinc finger family protein [Streptomyces sp. NBC_00963]|uniref:SWIM zinc finger family protein n=1 Tax=Streptomyces sp. NBC_00963 TaxID=2903697 RepID=UPI00386A6126|nr:SWIM zinc finger family protein [Streptomyces sp. NBC_00963]
MNQQGVRQEGRQGGRQWARWSADQVLALAPDVASLKAGSRLGGSSGSWSEAGWAGGSGAVWGLCSGSGGKPYRTVVDTTGVAYRCSCPSRKFPCKHALGLLLLWAAADEAVKDTPTPPEWVAEWLQGRRAARSEGSSAGVPGSGPGKAADPEAARRRAERRAERVTAGATELEQRLDDVLRGGMAGAEQSGYALWEETAARMVDAQAPGLAARVRELGAIPSSGQGWPVRLLEECAMLHLLDRAWLGRELLPDALATTVRTRVGLPVSAEGPPVRDRWLVLSQQDTTDGKLTTRRIWLHGSRSGRTAQLLDFGAAGRAPGVALPVGLTLDADLMPYPGSGQLRAALGERFGPPERSDGPPEGISTGAALSAYGQALRDDPWLGSWPATLSSVIPVPGAGGSSSWQLADAEGGSALPITPDASARTGLWKLTALSGGSPVTVFGECGHRGFTPLTAWTPGTAEAVPLT